MYFYYLILIKSFNLLIQWLLYLYMLFYNILLYIWDSFFNVVILLIVHLVKGLLFKLFTKFFLFFLLLELF